jgi:hypothetical protein
MLSRAPSQSSSLSEPSRATSERVRNGLTRCEAVFLLVALSTPIACNGKVEGTCNKPDHVIYSCSPVASDAGGCPQGPSIPGQAWDQDASFPLGCRATLPMCPPANDCYCQPGVSEGDAEPIARWSCFQ